MERSTHTPDATTDTDEMTTITVPAHENGVVRVFSLSMSSDQAQSLRNSRKGQRDALGLEKLDPRGIEVLRIDDLADIGLYGYLRDGVDVEEAELSRDRARLKALDGWVLLIYSSGFEGQKVEFMPTPELTLIGTYHQTRPEAARADLDAASAQPYSGTPTIEPPQPVRGRPGGAMVVLGLVVLVALTAWWVLT
ncbi:hypothetical protein FIU94_01950 [Sulfitobacter sp. THAF37]|uniref:hypothetical protein n=1 Tax=Sulfitobacter sp. THAF37 TaxID=2587855 RepID=UPI001268CD5F|nr:hypothetical protein [Sulfitobacter sp. THAF37]QFT57574.1 hypothetical protein FIU94_01950 [Sulfitobacter sp. THAF37]